MIIEKIQYIKSYLQTISEAKFQLIISILSTLFGITIVLISVKLYILLVIISLIIQSILYYKRSKQNA